MKKIILIMALLIAFAPFVSANTNWYSFGNHDFQGGGYGVDDILWGSNYPQGDTNMTNITFTTTNTIMPMVIDWDQDGSNTNEFILFSGSQILLYDSSLEFMYSYSLDNAIKGSACIGNLGDDADFELLIIDGDDLKFFQSDGLTIELTKTLNIGSKWDSVMCSLSWEGRENALIVDHATQEADMINIDSGETTDVLVAVPSRQLSGSALSFYNPIWAGDFDNDDKLEYGICTGSDAGINIDFYIWDVVNTTFELNNTEFLTASGSEAGCNFYPANVGSITSQKELFIEVWDESGTGLISKNHSMLDVGGNIKMTFPLNSNVSNFAVADIDNDGLNEACFRNASTYLCYNSVGIQEYSFIIDDDNFNFDYISIGEYKNSNAWQEIIAPSQIFEIQNSAGDTTTLMSLGESERRSFPYISEIKRKVPFKKDILIGKSSSLAVFSTFAQAVCGNGICETGETSLTCLEDCGIGDEKDVFISSVSIEPTNTVIWKNNTDVQVDVTVKSRNSYPIWAKAVLYSGSIYEDDSGYVEGIANSTISFQFKANHTTTQSNLRVYGKSSLDNSTDSKLFTFSVALSGAEFGDSEVDYFFEDPLETPPDDELDSDSNVVKDMIDTIAGSGKGGIGYIGIWILIMTIITVSIIFVGAQEKWNGTVVMVITIIINILLLIFGTLLGFIPLGVIIVFLIMGILAGVVIWRTSVTGA